MLLAMHQTLVERGLCLREQTEKGTLLIFPSYYRRERPELVEHPCGAGELSVQRASSTRSMPRWSSGCITPRRSSRTLWRYAADFKTLTGNNSA